jgi:hypothetical protein
MKITISITGRISKEVADQIIREALKKEKKLFGKGQTKKEVK